MPGRRLPRKQPPQNLRTVSKASAKNSSNVGMTPNSDLPENMKLQKEINWCIDQFRLGLMTQKSTPKQTEFTIKLIQTLSSPSAPLVKKRQIMRQAFGDYRTKMAEEETKWLKDAQRLQKVSSIQDTSYPNKSIYIRNSCDTGSSSISGIFASCSIKDIAPKEGVKQIDTEKPDQFRFNFEISE